MPATAPTRLSNRGALNCVSPINWLSPRNRGLLLHWLAVPGLTGGSRLVNLARLGDKDGCHGTLVGATWGGPFGRKGGAGAVYTSNVSNQEVVGSVLPQLNGATQLTMGGWLYRSAEGEFPAFARDIGPATRVGIYPFGTTTFFVVDTGSGGADSSIVFGWTGWTRIDMVYDGNLAAASRIRGFFNGREVSLARGNDAPTAIPTDNASQIRLNRTNGSVYGQAGYDDLSIHLGAFTPEEIWLRYVASLASYPSDHNYLRLPSQYLSEVSSGPLQMTADEGGVLITQADYW